MLLACGAALAKPAPLIECPAARAVATDGSTPAATTLVIIIDDMGNNLQWGRAALQLPGNLTFSVLPYSAFGEQLARRAHQAGKEVMLHAPMSNLHKIPLGPGGLTAQQTKQGFRATLEAGLATVPHAQGINNHMGSDLTQRRRQMAWLMQAMRQKGFYFVDSRTTGKTIAASVASEFGVPNVSRQVFLDNDRSTQAIDQRFQELLARAQREGSAVAIGHPYPETINYLETALPQLGEQGIRLAYVSEVVAGHRSTTRLASSAVETATQDPAAARNSDC